MERDPKQDKNRLQRSGGRLQIVSQLNTSEDNTVGHMGQFLHAYCRRFTSCFKTYISSSA